MAALLAFAVLILALASACGYGAGWLRALRYSSPNGALRWPLMAALGLGTLAYLILALGLAGFLNHGALLAAVAPGWLLLAWLRPAVADKHPGAKGSALERWAAIALFACLAVAAAMTLVTALAPPSALEWDSLSYHLAAPKIYLHQGRISLIAYDSHTDFPFTVEMLFTLGLAFGGATAAKLFHWALGWLTVAAVGAYAGRLRVAERSVPAWTGPLAAALFATVPVVMWEMGTAYVDLGTALYQLLALIVVLEILVPPASMQPTTGASTGPQRAPTSAEASESSVIASGQDTPSFSGPVAGAARPGTPLGAQPEPGSPSTAATSIRRGLPRPYGLAMTLLMQGRRDADSSTFNLQPSTGTPTLRIPGEVLAGVLSGFALGTKMTALIQFGLLGLALVWAAFRAAPASRRAMWTAVLGFGIAGVVVASPWYVKSWLWVHNPVYPFFYSLFPHSFSWTAADARAYATEQKSFGLGHGPLQLLTAPWSLAMHGRAFFINQRTLSGDKLGGLGPVWAGALPLLFWARGLDRRIPPILLYAGASFAVWFVTSQQSRYLLPLCAPLAIAAAGGIAAIAPAMVRRAAGIFVALALALNLWLMQPLVTALWPVVSGQQTADDYLSGSLGDLHQAAAFVNELPPDSRVAMYQETRGFYFDRPYFWANPGQHDLIPYDTLGSGTDLVRELRRFGITHVLINYDFCRGVEGFAWYRLLMDAIRQGALVEVFRSQKGEFQRRGVFVYRLQ